MFSSEVVEVDIDEDGKIACLEPEQELILALVLTSCWTLGAMMKDNLVILQ